MSDALRAYLEHPYRESEGILDRLARARAEEPHVAVWREYAQRARDAGVFAALAAVFPQLRFPIQEGISQEPAYAAATRRGRLEEADAFSPGLLLERPESLILTFSDGVAGMLPLVVAKGIGAGFNQAMAGIVVGGQTLSLVLTLVATPVIYSLFDDVAVWVRRRLPRGRTPEQTGELEIRGDEMPSAQAAE